MELSTDTHIELTEQRINELKNLIKNSRDKNAIFINRNSLKINERLLITLLYIKGN